MKSAVVILAFVAAVSAQFQYGQYNQGPYNQGQYNQGQYNPFNRLNNYNNRYRQYTTPAPFRYSPTATVAPVFPSSTPAPAPVPVAYAKVVASNDYNAETVRYGNEASPEGNYNYFYETNNGIAAQEQGTLQNFGGNPPAEAVVKQGSFSYTSPEGVPVAISYIANENGFQPEGNVIPTSPPIPPQILRSLEYLARVAPSQ